MTIGVASLLYLTSRTHSTSVRLPYLTTTHSLLAQVGCIKEDPHASLAQVGCVKEDENVAKDKDIDPPTPLQEMIKA